MQVVGEIALPGGDVAVVDDYGHHPTEIAATLDALRQAYAGRRIVLVFQPHRYTRTRDLMDDFSRVLATADTLLVTEVYSAGETPIDGADGRAICRAVRGRGKVEPVFVPTVDEIATELLGIVKPGDVIAMMGAGTISGAAHELAPRLKALLAGEGA
jgi:UDP-N-acetylmuramate--alanine ligase